VAKRNIRWLSKIFEVNRLNSILVVSRDKFFHKGCIFGKTFAINSEAGYLLVEIALKPKKPKELFPKPERNSFK
jgi:hypothetical protein